MTPTLYVTHSQDYCGSSNPSISFYLLISFCQETKSIKSTEPEKHTIIIHLSRRINSVFQLFSVQPWLYSVSHSVASVVVCTECIVAKRKPIGSRIWEIDCYQNEWPWPLFKGRIKVVSTIASHSPKDHQFLLRSFSLYGPYCIK